MSLVGVFAKCPACGSTLYVDVPIGVLQVDLICRNKNCPQPDAATKILSDPEIEHIVRFDEQGYFNAQHPLRERADGALLDCVIHEAVVDWVHDKPRGEFINTTWRVRRASEHNLDANWVWEQLT